jgi:type IV secretory pathway VirJ component
VEKNWLAQFKAAYGKVAATAPANEGETNVEALPGLPLILVPASGPPRDVMALHITGDGGWGITDRGLSETLAEKGVPVVGLNSLRYFWKARTPDGAAADVEKILRYYLTTWGKTRAVLIGYSFGADVLPFLVSRLPADMRSRVALVCLFGPGERADFQFHLGSWLGRTTSDSLPVRPELAKLGDVKILCFYGRKDKQSICADLPPGSVTAIEQEGGHLIWGRFAGIAEEILRALT